MDPLSLLVTSALYIGAEVGKKPADEFAAFVWTRVKEAFSALFGREPGASDLTTSNIASIVSTQPQIDQELQGVFGRVSGLRRARLAEKALNGARVLWIDDNPANNTWERRLFETLGMICVTVETTKSALRCLGAETFDLLISDIARLDVTRTGLDDLPLLRTTAPHVPVLFYVGTLSTSVPPEGAHGITNDPNELLHLVLDRLERQRL